MTTRLATCNCGQLKVRAHGEPIRVSVCHCLACQRRTGSVFGMQARFERDNIRIEGTAKQWVRIADPDFPEPKFSVYEERKHSWVRMPANAECID